MYIKQFTSGHPIGSSVDQLGLSGRSDFWPSARRWDIFSDNRNFDERIPEAPVCHIITYQYVLETVLLWESLLPILAAILLWRSGRNTSEAQESSNITTTSWLLIVIHSNLTCYFWITYYIVDNVYGCTTRHHYAVTNFNPHAAKVPVIGAICLGIALVISATAAIRNDMYYPDAQMSPKEATSYINYLKVTNPEMNVILKSHVRLTDHGHQLYDANTGQRVDISYIGYPANANAEGWKRPKKSFQPSNWYTHAGNLERCNCKLSRHT